MLNQLPLSSWYGLPQMSNTWSQLQKVRGKIQTCSQLRAHRYRIPTVVVFFVVVFYHFLKLRNNIKLIFVNVQVVRKCWLILIYTFARNKWNIFSKNKVKKNLPTATHGLLCEYFLFWNWLRHVAWSFCIDILEFRLKTRPYTIKQYQQLKQKLNMICFGDISRFDNQYS